MTLPYVVQALAWLNTRTLALMDARERLHVVDVKSQEELERIDLASLGLVYASPQFKAIATGGNVSKAMVSVCFFFFFFYTLEGYWVRWKKLDIKKNRACRQTL